MFYIDNEQGKLYLGFEAAKQAAIDKHREDGFSHTVTEIKGRYHKTVYYIGEVEVEAIKTKDNYEMEENN
jgi:hypothetical protein